MTRAGDGPGRRSQNVLRNKNFGERESPAEPARSKSLTGPTILTIVRMIFSIVFMAFMLIPETWAKVIALIVFILAAITDKIDGIWARNKHLVTDLGAFLDPLADKMLTSLAFLVLVYLNAIPLWVFAIILVRDFTVDGMRMMVARNGVTVAASSLGKLKTTFQMIALIIILLNQVLNIDTFIIIGNIVLYLSLILCVISGYDYLTKGWKQITRSSRQKR